VLMHRQQF
jgi:Domain of unknown function (DUF1906)